MAGRHWEIDFARGLAVIAMVAYNWAYALAFLGRADFPIGSELFFWLARLIGFAFVFISGLSLRISYMNGRNQMDEKELNKKLLRRAAFLSTIAVLITLVTFLYDPFYTIWFGVIHLIALSTLISIPLLKAESTNPFPLIGIAAIIFGVVLSQFPFDNPYFLWLGLQPDNFTTFDYFPLLPWYGVFLLGIWFSANVFPANRKLEKFAVGQKLTAMKLPLIQNISIFLGRHSLIIYLLHQPLLLALIYLAEKISAI